MRKTLLFVTMLLGACRTQPRGGTTEAVDDLTLPAVVVAFREAVRGAHTVRVWLSNPDAGVD